MKKQLEKYLYLPDLLIAALIGLYACLCYTMAELNGFGGFYTPLMYGSAQTTFSAGLLILYILYRLQRIYYIMLITRPPNLKKYIWDDLKKGPLNHERWRRFPILFIAFVFFFSSFTCMKILISEIYPFAWDEPFMKLDRAIHFGMDPWQILQPIIGYPIITKFIAFFYVLWFPGIFFVMYWQLFSLRNPQLRTRFFITLIIAWALNGTFLGTYLSSAGPCFYEKVTGSNHYAPLMEYLRAVNDQWNIYAIEAQDVLWDNFAARGKILAGGISAMPSIHITVTFLFVLLGFHTSKWHFRAFLAWFICIFIGSIHLGWHYAVDGYLAMVTTYVIWKAVGLLMSRCRSWQSLQDSHAAASRRH